MRMKSWDLIQINGTLHAAATMRGTFAASQVHNGSTSQLKASARETLRTGVCTFVPGWKGGGGDCHIHGYSFTRRANVSPSRRTNAMEKRNDGTIEKRRCPTDCTWKPFLSGPKGGSIYVFPDQRYAASACRVNLLHPLVLTLYAYAQFDWESHIWLPSNDCD